MEQARLRVMLLSSYLDPTSTAEIAARRCYSGKSTESIMERVWGDDDHDSAYIRGVLASGHLSVAEHAPFTFAVEGVSRALLAQLTRHRVASFSVMSQRYVSSGSGFDYIVPPSIEALGQDAVDEYAGQMKMVAGWYAKWQERLGSAGESSNEDARFVLPNAAETKIVFTMNARELLHFFELRCCNRAQWEIREMAWQMLEICKKEAPSLFAKAGPPCAFGKCPEGKRSCGQHAGVTMRLCQLDRTVKYGKAGDLV